MTSWVKRYGPARGSTLNDWPARFATVRKRRCQGSNGEGKRNCDGSMNPGYGPTCIARSMPCSPGLDRAEVTPEILELFGGVSSYLHSGGVQKFRILAS